MRIRELREERHLRQIDVADAIQTSQTNIGRWENGANEPSSSFVVKLADFFNVSTDYLLGRSDDFGAVVAGQSSPRLTDEEKVILELYRRMNHAQRVRFQGYGEGMLGDDVAGEGRA